MKKTKITAYLDAVLFDELDALATQRRVPKTQIIEAALASFLSPDGVEQNEAAWQRHGTRQKADKRRVEPAVPLLR